MAWAFLAQASTTHEAKLDDPKTYLKNLAGTDYEILYCIAEKESNWKNIPNYLYDGEEGRYTAYGPFQILKSTALRYSDEDRRDVYANIRIAVKIFKNEGSKPWLVANQCVNK